MKNKIPTIDSLLKLKNIKKDKNYRFTIKGKGNYSIQGYDLYNLQLTNEDHYGKN